MIVKMRKITLLCLTNERDRSLEVLRDTGVLHLVPINNPDGAALESARSLADRATTALRILKANSTKATTASGTAVSAAEVVELAQKLEERKEELTEEIEILEAEESELEPFGDFNPALLKDIREKGVFVRLYRTTDAEVPAPKEGVTVVSLGTTKPTIAYAAMSQTDFRLDLPEFDVPSQSLEEVRSKLVELRAALKSVKEQLTSLAASLEPLRGHAAQLAEQAKFVEVRESMAMAGSLSYLRGFCPVDSEAKLREAATREGWGLLIEEPAADDKVPTLIRNPAWIRPIESLFGFIKMLPGYNEVDVSASFLFFLSIFFAMIVGDAGYGLIFLALTFFGRLKMPKAPPDPFRLLYIFSFCTIAWGVVSGAYFGVTTLWAPLAKLRLDWLGSEQNMMHLCLIIGAIHLTVAHAWNMVRFINSTQAIAQAGWISVTWTIFFLARQMILNTPFPSWYVWPAAIGSVAALVFMTPFCKLKTEWINHVMLPLTLMSYFGDVLSYLRLFALSIAGLQLAMAFNTMAGAVGFGSIGAGMGAALILFAGHTLNIVLSAISVLVHGIRLNALEFSMHFGLEWAGFSYDPFAKRVSTNENKE